MDAGGERRCSSPGGYRARTAWGRDGWKAERDKEKANKVARQVRRAEALTAEFAAQSEKKSALVCDQPPGLRELAGHIEAPTMGAGGSHPQATMMPDPWATSSRPPQARARPRPAVLLRQQLQTVVCKLCPWQTRARALTGASVKLDPCLSATRNVEDEKLG